MTTLQANPTTPSGADPDTITELVILHRQRKATIRQVNRMNNATLALVRSSLGFRAVIPRDDYETAAEHKAAQKANDALKKQAQDIVKAVEKGQHVLDDHSKHAHLAPYILSAASAREPFDNYRKTAEKRRAVLVRSLEPIWQWAECIPGFAEQSVADIIGECGNLSNYANPGKVWKRMYLAPYNGKAMSTWKRRGGLSKAEWIDLGARDSGGTVAFNIAEAMTKQSESEYRDIYIERLRTEYDKAEADGTPLATASQATVDSWVKRGLPAPLKVSKVEEGKHRGVGHANNRARRYMVKRLLREMWRVWRDSYGVHCVVVTQEPIDPDDNE